MALGGRRASATVTFPMKGEAVAVGAFAILSLGETVATDAFLMWALGAQLRLGGPFARITFQCGAVTGGNGLDMSQQHVCKQEAGWHVQAHAQINELLHSNGIICKDEM